MGGINYLFPPDQIQNLDSWRFILHFPEEGQHDRERLSTASEQLKSAEFKVVEFPLGLDLKFDPNTQAVDIAIEVSEERRHRPNGLDDYESDVWKILGNMASCGYEEVFYEAVDWREDEPSPTKSRKKWWQFWR